MGSRRNGADDLIWLDRAIGYAGEEEHERAERYLRMVRQDVLEEMFRAGGARRKDFGLVAG